MITPPHSCDSPPLHPPQLVKKPNINYVQYPNGNLPNNNMHSQRVVLSSQSPQAILGLPILESGVSLPNRSPNVVMPSPSPIMVPSQSPNIGLPNQSPVTIPRQSPIMIPRQSPNMTLSQSPHILNSQSPNIIPCPSPNLIPLQSPNLMSSQSPNIILSQSPTYRQSPSPIYIPSQSPNMSQHNRTICFERSNSIGDLSNQATNIVAPSFCSTIQSSRNNILHNPSAPENINATLGGHMNPGYIFQVLSNPNNQLHQQTIPSSTVTRPSFVSSTVTRPSFVSSTVTRPSFVTARSSSDGSNSISPLLDKALLMSPSKCFYPELSVLSPLRNYDFGISPLKRSDADIKNEVKNGFGFDLSVFSPVKIKKEETIYDDPRTSLPRPDIESIKHDSVLLNLSSSSNYHNASNSSLNSSRYDSFNTIFHYV